MNKNLIPILLLMVVTGACLPAPVPTASAPQVDMQATIDSIVKTAAAQTLAAQPSPTTAPPTETPTAVVEPSSTPSVNDEPSSTPVPNLTTTPVTATSGAIDSSNITPTSTTVGISGSPTLTPTLGVLLYGTLPPAVPSSDVYLVNKSKTQVYISLQLCDTEAKGAILEYPVQNSIKIKAPIGNYLYVVWVGGRQLIGNLKVNKSEDLKITIFKDKVVIQ